MIHGLDCEWPCEYSYGDLCVCTIVVVVVRTGQLALVNAT